MNDKNTAKLEAKRVKIQLTNWIAGGGGGVQIRKIHNPESDFSEIIETSR